MRSWRRPNGTGRRDKCDGTVSVYGFFGGVSATTSSIPTGPLNSTDMTDSRLGSRRRKTGDPGHSVLRAPRTEECFRGLLGRRPPTGHTETPRPVSRGDSLVGDLGPKLPFVPRRGEWGAPRTKYTVNGQRYEMESKYSGRRSRTTEIVPELDTNGVRKTLQGDPTGTPNVEVPTFEYLGGESGSSGVRRPVWDGVLTLTLDQDLTVYERDTTYPRLFGTSPVERECPGEPRSSSPPTRPGVSHLSSLFNY